jgi:glycosyltransferase involved in cell wall biosynthesis
MPGLRDPAYVVHDGYAFRSNPNVTVLPTVVSRNKWRPQPGRLGGAFATDSGVPVIGWIGTQAAAYTLEVAAPALRRLRQDGRRFVLRVVGAAKDFRLPGLEHEVVPWQREREVQDFQELDIGIAPAFAPRLLEGQVWLPLLQYMAVGVPSVASPEGGVVDFMRHGENGLFARSDDEWVAALGALLDDQALRARSRGRRALIEGSFIRSKPRAPRLGKSLAGGGAVESGPLLAHP